MINDMDVPLFVLKDMESGERPPEDMVLHVTDLIRPIRSLKLEQMHPGQRRTTASGAYKAWVGTCLHERLTKAVRLYLPDAQVAMPVQCQVGPYKLVGEVDLFHNKVVLDWKTGTGYRVKQYKITNWEAQTNLYAWILRNSGDAVEHIAIQFIQLDWSPMRSFSDEGCPTGMRMIPMRIWTDEECVQFVTERVAQLMAPELPECTDEQRGITTQYAVMNKKGARAKNNGICTTMEDAVAIQEPGELIKIRRSDPIMCNHFCSARFICEHSICYQQP